MIQNQYVFLYKLVKLSVEQLTKIEEELIMMIHLPYANVVDL